MIHPIDRAAELMLARGPQHLRFFTGGWGDPNHLRDLDVERLDDPAQPHIDWAPDSVVDGLIVRDGEFVSPFAGLPAGVGLASVRLVLPSPATDRVIVLMAAWNDHGYATRTKLAAEIARLGIGSAILENPFYGSRRPDPAVHQPITTVADFAAMGRGAVEEARALLLALRHRFRLVGVGGYSMGGSVGALVSATMPFPVATAPLAAAHSPAPVYTEGVLRKGVAWEALGGEAMGTPRLAELLGLASTIRYPAPAHARHAVLVAATNDGFVPPAATVALHEHWEGSELRWRRAGHGTLLWFGKRHLAAAVATSFARIDQPAAGS